MSECKQKKGSRFLVLQRQILRRRLWLMAAIILYMVLYYPVAIIMLIARSNESAALQGFNAVQTLDQRLGEVGTWIGIRQNFSQAVVVIAVVLALQGFSYLFSMDKQDFYESQPVSRRERFWNIYSNGFLMFELPLVVCMFLSIGCATLMGAMNGITFLDAVIQLVRLTILFLASYSIGITAVMLSGNLIISGLLATFILVADQVIKDVLRYLESSYFKTWAYLGEKDPVFMLSPLYNSEAPRRWLGNHYGSTLTYSGMTAEGLNTLVSASWKADLASLVVGVIFLMLAAKLYKMRKMEYAGHTVLYRPLRSFVRIVISVAAGLFAGTIVIRLFGSVESRTGTAFVLLGIIVAAVLCAGVIEIIYDLDIWKFFARFGEIIAAALAAALIFIVFRYDLIGYDRYVPDPDKVESAALYVYGDSTYYYEDAAISYSGNDQFVLDRMNLTDIEALEEITRPAMEAMAQMSMNSSPVTEGWSAVVCYRLKNGRNVYRSILIPYTMEASVLDKVISSPAYKFGLIPIYTEQKTLQAAKENGTISFYNGFDVRKASGALYEEFAAAYEKDLEKYSYTQLSEEDSIGRLALRTRGGAIDQEYDVYPSYTNTLAFLEKYDLLPEAGKAEQVSEIRIYQYLDTSTSQVSYTDPKQIQEILDHCIMRVSGNWKKDDELDYSLSVNQTLSGNADAYTFGLYFKKGEIPDFVQEDLAANAEEISE